MNIVHKLSIAKSVSQLEDLSASFFEVYHTVLRTLLLIDLKPKTQQSGEKKTSPHDKGDLDCPK